VTPTEPIPCAFSVARASRNPALEELYFTPPHSGNNAVENGNADLDSEHSVGFDVSLWWRSSIASGEVTFFANRINDFIFRRFTGAVDEESGLAVTEFDQADASMKGIESHVDLRVTPILWVEGGLDYVRGDLTSFDLPMPRSAAITWSRWRACPQECFSNTITMRLDATRALCHNHLQDFAPEMGRNLAVASSVRF